MLSQSFYLISSTNYFWTLGPQQQLGQLTSYHDASMIYGSSSLEHQTLRDFEMPSESLFRDT